MPDFPGLNLTFEVREGIIKHSRDYSRRRADSRARRIPARSAPAARSPADRPGRRDRLQHRRSGRRLRGAPARRAHAAGRVARICRMPMPPSSAATRRGAPSSNSTRPSERILDRLATDLIEHTRAQVLASGAQSLEEIRRAPGRFAGFSPEAAQLNAALKRFLFKQALRQSGHRRGAGPLGGRPGISLPPLHGAPRNHAAATSPGRHEREPIHRVVCDYIAGMTDDFMLRQYRSLADGPART